MLVIANWLINYFDKVCQMGSCYNASITKMGICYSTSMIRNEGIVLMRTDSYLMVQIIVQININLLARS